MRPIVLPRNELEMPTRSQKAGATSYAVAALVWAISATDTLYLTERRTGAICPPGAWESMIPLAQLVLLVVDASILRQVATMRQRPEEKHTSWHALGDMFSACAGLLAFMAVWSCIDRNYLRWNLFLDPVSARHLLIDSLLVSVGFLAATYLLGTFHPTTIALAAVSASLVFHLESEVFKGTMTAVWAAWPDLITGAVLFLGAGILWQNAPQPLGQPQVTSSSSSYKTKCGGFALLAFATVVFQLLWQEPGHAPSDTIGNVIANATKESSQWMTNAKKSKNLDEAVVEYSERYGMPPPPNFDKWYAYATSVDSPIIDDFGQIYSDLLPFWGVRPALLRQRSVHLLEHPGLSFGGIVIQDGKVEVSPHIHGTHRWMMDVTKDMIEPFAKWLPDMQLAFNLDDECRVSLPHESREAYAAAGRASQARLAAKPKHRGFSPAQQPPWPTDYLKDTAENQKLWNKTSPWFQNWSKSAMFYEWVASTCPPDALANRLHWWNRKAECAECSAPHLAAGVVANWTLSGDLCHQPDLAYLHGFLAAPAALVGTRALLPVFSQSRLHNFADVLYPSPWNFGDKVVHDDRQDVAWEDQLNSVYWRGAASDGYATHGAWEGFLRARFVHMARSMGAFLQQASAGAHPAAPRHPAPAPGPPIAVNVSFVGPWARCDTRDCELEQAAFYGRAGSATAAPPRPVDFQEHWRHRHLVDLDGAAFSGRFLPFLRSRALPYRAALFRTWWDERVHAWAHFVPLDARLADLWRLVGYLGGGAGPGPGPAAAERIAADGRRWAARALRKDDMRVYMFRLLLEWGRLVDDGREELGYWSW